LPVNDAGSVGDDVTEHDISDAADEVGDEGSKDGEAIKTYRYLRISMVGVVVLLAASVILERSDVNCWQTSISAYYYTPVRAIFVGGLMAIGLCLIVIKGSTPFEDATLNVAGMLAPVVAVVPTSNVGACWSVEPRPLPVTADGTLAEWVVANVDNNITALLIAGIGGLLAAAVIASVATRNMRAIAEVGEPGTRFGLLVAMLLLIGGAIAFRAWDDFDTKAHSIAAIAMFGFLAASIAGNAWQRKGRPDARIYFWLYAGIAAAMVVSAAAMFALKGDWEHMVFVLEATEITLFAAFWLVQTQELWNETVT
jgi:hypothetical protein